MRRRAALSGVCGSLTGMFVGCLGTLPNGTGSDSPRVVGLEAGNWHPDPQALNVLIETTDDVLYERQVQLPGGEPSEYDRPPVELDGYPSDLPPSATLVTWVENASRDDARTLDFGGRTTECIRIEIDICPACGDQKGQEDTTVPAIPDTLIKYTYGCDPVETPDG